MLNFPGPEKILILAIIALVVLGPSRLPQAARTAGKWIGELRKLTSRFQEEVSGALGDPKDGLTAAVSDLRNEVGTWRNEVAGLGRSLTTTASITESQPVPTAPATWTNGTSSNTVSSPSSPSNPSTDYVSSGLVSPGLPSLPPAPDDPSLN